MKDMTKQERAEMWRQLAEYVEQLEDGIETQRTQLKSRQETNKELRSMRADLIKKYDLAETAFILACKFIANYGECPASQLDVAPWNCSLMCDEVDGDVSLCWRKHFENEARVYLNPPW